ncbi:MAG: IclR family transcriptional regulator C-terminal domain-containing protein [Sedimenticolaceae bacterium]
MAHESLGRCGPAVGTEWQQRLEGMGYVAVARKSGGGGAGASKAGSVKALDRGLSLLECLAASEHGMTQSDLAMMVGIPPATTFRLLNTLEQRKFVYQDVERARWFVGQKAFQTGSAFLESRDFVVQSRPYLRALMEQSNETANLAVAESGEAVILAQVQSREMMRMIVPLGSQSPMHASGLGKALLAAMDDGAVSSVLHRHGLPAITEHSITSPEQLRQTLEDIRARGWAYDDEEHALGLRCVAATIHDEFGNALAAVSISGPKSRITDGKFPELGQLVCRTAAEITATIGGRMPIPRQPAARAS